MHADYPLLIKQLLITPLAQAPDQEIVYREVSRRTYRCLRERIGRLASGLRALGIGHGDTVAVLDWDSHRYLECFFAVPMMGAVLMTANIRLGLQALQYTLQQASPRVLLVHRDSVIAVPDAKWGERPVAIVVARGGAHRIDAQSVRSHLAVHVEAGRIPRYAIPEAIHFVDALPRPRVGKYDKRAMRERYQPTEETP